MDFRFKYEYPPRYFSEEGPDSERSYVQIITAPSYEVAKQRLLAIKGDVQITCVWQYDHKQDEWRAYKED